MPGPLIAETALEGSPAGVALVAFSGAVTGVAVDLTGVSLRVSTGGTGAVGMAGVAGFTGIAPEGLPDDVSLFSGSDRMDLILSKIPMMALPLFVNSLLELYYKDVGKCQRMLRIN